MIKLTFKNEIIKKFVDDDWIKREFTYYLYETESFKYVNGTYLLVPNKGINYTSYRFDGFRPQESLEKTGSIIKSDFYVFVFVKEMRGSDKDYRIFNSFILMDFYHTTPRKKHDKDQFTLSVCIELNKYNSYSPIKPASSLFFVFEEGKLTKIRYDDVFKYSYFLALSEANKWYYCELLW
jgi:hypothetical protein